MEDSNPHQHEGLDPPPPWMASSEVAITTGRREQLRSRLLFMQYELRKEFFVEAARRIDGAEPLVRSTRESIEEALQELEKRPAVQIALLGPSRHGKSTLINALSASSLLPTSDIRPCTAAIMTLRYDTEWGFEINFVKERRLEAERRLALADARDYLQRCGSRFNREEAADDPRYLQTSLERFIDLLGIDAGLSPQELVDAVEHTPIPDRIQRLLGQRATPKEYSLEGMRATIGKYLSTDDIYWTIVDRCVISGPLDDWHESLELVDLPGTNDNDPQRTTITNSLRKQARAVAVCTSDSNLGIDITSWLQNSSVLGDYLEATDRARQQLFIIKTKFDAHIPQISIDEEDAEDQESEDRLYQEAIERHKQQQTATYREMLRDIAQPLLPMGRTDDEKRKREEMLARIDSIEVHFVSAMAFEAFQGRLNTTRRAKARLSEQFGDDPSATGIPGLKSFINTIAAEYLAAFYYDDLELRVGKEVGRLVRYFQQRWNSLEAGLGEAAEAIAALAAILEEEVLPRLAGQIQTGQLRFVNAAQNAAEASRDGMRRAQQELHERIKPAREAWAQLYWNTLRALGRKRGVHTTSRGQFLDINQVVCGALLDDVSLLWATFRDDTIAVQVERFAAGVVEDLSSSLAQAASRIADEATSQAIQRVVKSLQQSAQSQREQMSSHVASVVHQLQSIRQPAYDEIQQTLDPTYSLLASEQGQGCQARMRTSLDQGATSCSQELYARVSAIVLRGLDRLGAGAAEVLGRFGADAAQELANGASELRRIGKTEERQRLLAELDAVGVAARLLWKAIETSRATPTQPPDVLLLPSPDLLLAAAVVVEVPVDPTPPTSGEPTLLEAVASPSQSENAIGHVSELPGGVESSLPAEELSGSESHLIVERIADSLESIIRSETYALQRTRCGSAAPRDEQVLMILHTLQDHHWKMTVAALSEHTGIPLFRLWPLLSVTRRVLNFDGQPTLRTCTESDTVEVNRELLFREFAD